jgi:hypothetical protein
MNVQDLTIMLICGQRRLLSVVNLTIFADKRSPERDFIPILLVVNKQRIHEPYTLPWCAQWVLKHMRTSSLLMRPGVFQHTIALDHTFLLPQPYGFYIFLRESTTVPAIALPLWVTQRMVRYLKLLFEVRFGIGPMLSICLSLDDAWCWSFVGVWRLNKAETLQVPLPPTTLSWPNKPWMHSESW